MEYDHSPDLSRTEAVLIGFGSNLGDSALIYTEVGRLLDQDDAISDVQLSRLISTTPIGGPAGQSVYRNGAISFQFRPSLDSALEPLETGEQAGARAVHQKLRNLETAFGRVRKERWGSRKIDLDLLLFGDAFFESEELTVPHPRMSFRRFVIEPAAEIAPRQIHPESGLTIEELRKRLNRKARRVGVIGEIGGYDALLSKLQQSSSQFTFDFKSGPLSDGEWTTGLSLLIHLRSQSRSERLRSTNAPTLQVFVGDDTNLELEIQAALDGVLPFEISMD